MVASVEIEVVEHDCLVSVVRRVRAVHWRGILAFQWRSRHGSDSNSNQDGEELHSEEGRSAIVRRSNGFSTKVCEEELV